MSKQDARNDQREWPEPEAAFGPPIGLDVLRRMAGTEIMETSIPVPDDRSDKPDLFQFGGVQSSPALKPK